MYKIWEILYHIGIKLQSRMFCPNYTTLDHKLNSWDKIGSKIYKCCDCGCEVTIGEEVTIEEEEIINE